MIFHKSWLFFDIVQSFQLVHCLICLLEQFYLSVNSASFFQI